MMKLAAITAAAIVISCEAFAGTIDFSTHITDLSGHDIPISQTDKTPLDLGTVAETALLSPDQPTSMSPDQSTPEEKTKRFNLAMKVHAAKSVALSAEETALIKRVIGKDYPPLVVGRAFEILDPSPNLPTK